MKLNSWTLQKVKESPAVRKLLGESLGVHKATISRYLAENSDDLTKAAALKVIREYFNLTDEQILVEEKEAA